MFQALVNGIRALGNRLGLGIGGRDEPALFAEKSALAGRRSKDFIDPGPFHSHFILHFGR